MSALVNYQHDLYIGKDSTWYKVKKYAHQIDPNGVLGQKLRQFEFPCPNENPSEPDATTSPPNLAGYQRHKTTRTSSQSKIVFNTFDLNKEDHSFDWKLV